MASNRSALISSNFAGMLVEAVICKLDVLRRPGQGDGGKSTEVGVGLESAKGMGEGQRLPNGVPHHIMTPRLQDGDDLIFLLWGERLGHLVDSIQQIILDFLEGRHGRLETGSVDVDVDDADGGHGFESGKGVQ